MIFSPNRVHPRASSAKTRFGKALRVHEAQRPSPTMNPLTDHYIKIGNASGKNVWFERRPRVRWSLLLQSCQTIRPSNAYYFPPGCRALSLSLSQTQSDWQLIENRAMLLRDERSCQAHCSDGRRQILWFGVTTDPTAEWIANQLTEACGWEQAPRYLIRDRDGAYGEIFIRRLRSTSPRSPWQNGYAERLIGSIRRECLDHVIVFSERHLRHLLLC
jgi:hypothetical protein